MTEFIGKSMTTILETDPFRRWPVHKSIDSEDKPPTIDYVFGNHGLEVKCDSRDLVQTIFMYAEEYGGFDETLLDFSFASSRQDVISNLGTPSKSGERRNDPVLSEYGPWDRFDYADPDFSAHFQYQLDGQRIAMFTLMRGDVVPGYRT